MSKKEIKFISYMQVTGMLLVALSHSFSDEFGFSSGVFMFVKLIQWAALTSFMWCSGYLFVANEPVKKHGINKFYVGRFERLMLPYVFVSLIMLVPKLLIGAANGKFVGIDVFKLIFCPRESVLPHLWFLPTLMIISLLAPLFDMIIKNKWCAIGLAAVAMVLVFLPDITGFFAIDDVKRYAFWFVFGMIAAKTGPKNKDGATVKWPLALGSAITYALILLTGFNENVKFLLLGICSLEILIFIAENAGRVFKKTYLKKYTMVIYVLSVPSQNLAEILLKKVGITGILGALVLLSVGIAVPMIIGKAVSEIFTAHGKYFPGKLIGMAEKKS